jgi:hypothetical protein
MIVNNAVNVNSFIFCSVYQGPNETTNYFNSGNGHFHESIYLVEGKATYAITDTEVESPKDAHYPLVADKLTDITPSKGKYVITKTNAIGASMIMFNPIPESKHLAVEIVKGAKTLTVTASDQRITVICITGPVTIKDKVLQSMQYAVVFANTETTLVLSKNTICALVTG